MRRWALGVVLVVIVGVVGGGDQAAEGGAFVSPVFLPLIQGSYGGVVPHGAGVGGCPWTAAQRDAAGISWCYWWHPDCRNCTWCVPMLRPIYDWPDVAKSLMSCGGPCGAVLLLNEPNLADQDDCDPACQAAFLHEKQNQVRAVTPQARIIFGNFWRPDPSLVDQVVAAWEQLYPGEPWPAEIWIGVHHYAWRGTYEKERWRAELRAFRAHVQGTLGTDVVLTEFGSLLDLGLWYEVVGDQVDWLQAEGIAFAPFLWWESEDGYYCTMWRNGRLTRCGQFYAGLTE